MKPTIYLAHGFNVRSPEKFFRLGAIFEAEGYPVVRVDYGWTGLVSVTWATERTAQKLAEVMHPGSIILGHSNGCAIAHRASQLGGMVRQIIAINPALRWDTIFDGDLLDRVDVYYAADDKVVTWGKRWRYISPFKSEWGEMGRKGARFTGQRVTVMNHSLHTVLHTDEWIGHGGAFEWFHLDDLGRHILGQIV